MPEESAPGEVPINISKIGAIITDYDRTITDDSLRPYTPVMEALGLLKKKFGLKVIIASGRLLNFLVEHLARFQLFDAYVAENGAVLHLPGTDRTIALGQGAAGLGPALRELKIPFDKGRVMMSVKAEHTESVVKLIREKALGVDIQRNRDSIMLLPSGISKGTGASEALKTLAIDGKELICIGDAENDIPLFEIASVSVAPSNALPEVKRRADVVCEGGGVAGVTKFLTGLVTGRPKDDH